jgi:uncharacterized protein (TIGR03086 family)
MDQAQALAAANDQFTARLTAVGPDQWGATTPCEKWPVRTLVAHVVGGHLMAACILEGGSRDEGLAAMKGDVLGDDALAAWLGACETLTSAIAANPDQGRTVHHPATDMPAATVVEFRISDALVHGWDLARGIGGDDTLDPDLVAYAWARTEPMAGGMAATGMFGEGPSGTLAAEATLQERLLDAMGRRP